MGTGLIAEPCVLWTGFDVSIVARSYAQLASLLAGFAFVVINILLDRAYRRRSHNHSPDAREGEHEALTGVSLVNGFFGLFLAALQYSLLAGENGCALTAGRAASTEVLASIAFVASMYVLLYAIVQFVSGTNSDLATHLVFVLVLLVPPISVFFVEATLGDLAIALGDQKTRQPLQPLWDWSNRLSIPITLMVGIVCATMWYMGIKRRHADTPSGRIAQNVRTAIPYITVAVVISVILRSVAALPVTNPAAHIAPTEAWLWTILFAVLLIVQSAALSFQKGVETSVSNVEKDSA